MATYYVSTSGSDTNAGTLAAPWRTIQKAANTVAAGDTVNIRAGTYREAVTFGGAAGTAANPITFQNYNGEQVFIKGSDAFTSGWTLHSGNIWKRSAPASGSMMANAQQVFVDFTEANLSVNEGLQQIGRPAAHYSIPADGGGFYLYPHPVGDYTNVATMVAGSFLCDAATRTSPYTGGTLYVWLADGSNPNSHTIEISVRRWLIKFSQPYYIVDGLKFRHCNGSAQDQQAAALQLYTNCTVRNCDIQRVDFSGFTMHYGGSNCSVINTISSYNGDTGGHSSTHFNFLVQGCILNHNNYRNFEGLWHSGGFKGASDCYGTIETTEAGHNNAPGIWFDYCNNTEPIVVRYNYVHHNGLQPNGANDEYGEAGMMFEGTSHVVCHNNIISYNFRRGLYMSAAWDCKIYNNTIVGNSGQAAVDVAGMPRDKGLNCVNVLYNNIISHNTASWDLRLPKPNGSTIHGNVCDYNIIYRSGGANLTFQYGGTSVTGATALASWRTQTGQDNNSIQSNPTFANSADPSPGNADNLKITAGSPASNAGTSAVSAYVTRDYFGTSRPLGAGYDIGAHELS